MKMSKKEIATYLKYTRAREVKKKSSRVNKSAFNLTAD